MSESTHTLGREGEEAALLFLGQNGYRPVARNYRLRRGEIDLIAEENGTLCFVEIKSRRHQDEVSALEAVDVPKQRRIAAAALQFLQERKWLDRRCRFDVVAVTHDGTTYRFGLVKDAFALPDNLR